MWYNVRAILSYRSNKKCIRNSKKIFLVMSILGILFTNNYANVVKEVQLIDDFSAELLGETKNQEAEVPEPPVQQQAQEITGR